MSNIVYYNSQDIMAEYDTYWAEGYRAWGQTYPSMALSLRQYLGDQWTLEEIQALKEEGRHHYTFNYAKPKIDWVNGYQIENRYSTVVNPIQDSFQQTADQMTKGLLFVLDKCGGYKCISETFGGGNKSGWGMANVYFDYNTDPINGDFRFSRDPYSGIIMDPYFSDLSTMLDCSWVMKRKYLVPTVANTLLPGQEEEVQQLARDGWERDNKFTWMVFQRVPTGQRMMAYNEFFRLKYEPQKVIVNKMTKQFIDWNGSEDDYSELKHLADSQRHDLEIVSRKRRFVEKHIILNNNYMRTEINPYGLDEYPFSMYAPIWEPESEEFTYKVQSLMQLLIDPSREYNRRRSQMIDIVESQLNGGWIEEDGAVKNPKMLYQSGQGRRIVLNKGYRRDSIDRIPPAVVPPAFFQETNQNEKDFLAILAMNETSMGMQDSKQVSALVEMHRQKAGMIGQATLFDRVAQMQTALSVKIIKMLQQWSPYKLTQILGEEPTEQFFDKDLTKYHVTTAEGVLTNTQRYMFFRQVMELKELGEPVPPGELTKLAPLQGKTEFLKDVQAFQQQQTQQMQEQQQAAMQHEQAVSQSLQARAVSDIALSKEREARAISNLGLEDERIAKAALDRDEAILLKIKAIQELSKAETEHLSLKDDRLIKMMQFFQAYEAHQKAMEETEKQENLSQSKTGQKQTTSAQ
jgi:hypothetical protein